MEANYLLWITLHPLSATPTKWPNTLKQFVGKSLMHYLSVFDHFVKLALNVLRGLQSLPQISGNLLQFKIYDL